jgi:ABC-type transport system substrate-binding protein
MKNIRNYTKSVKILISFVVCAALMLTSCSSIQTMLIDDTAARESQAPQSTVQPVRGGEMFIAYPGDTESLDPLAARNEDLINLLSLVYETPLAVDASGKIGPNLVENWQVDDTDTAFTFSVRKGVTFHDGQPLTAADMYATILDILDLDGTGLKGHVVNSIDTSAADNAEGNPADEPAASPDAAGNAGANIGAPTYIEMWTTVGGDTAAGGNETNDGGNETNDGGNETNDGGTPADNAAAEGINRYTIYNSGIESVTQVDDYTIRLKMKSPGRAALYFMTFPVRQKGMTDFGQPMGSGPYKADSVGEEIQLSVNDDWWKVSPYIESIVARPVQDQSGKISDYESGLLDLITTDSIAAGKLKAAGKTQTVDYLTNYYDCLVPNLFDESMKNDNVRKAVSYAINRRNIISTVLLNHAVAAEMPISPSFFAFNTKYNLYEYDKNMAKKHLNEAGYGTQANGTGNVLSLTMIVPDKVGEEYRVEAARAIAGQLTDVGIICNLEELAPNEYAARLQSGNFTLAYVSYYLDQSLDISFLFQPDGPSNFGHIASQELMDNIAACNGAVSESEMMSAYDTLEKYFMDKVPQIGLYFRMNSIIADTSVMGIAAAYENHIYANIADWSVVQNH